MRFRDYFTKDFETSDTSFYDTLRTRYYRCHTDEALNAIRQVVEQEKANIIDENKQFLEVLFESPEYSCIAKITATTPIEMAIDFKVTTFNLIGMGKGKKIIERLYSLVNSRLPFKGVGLYKG